MWPKEELLNLSQLQGTWAAAACVSKLQLEKQISTSHHRINEERKKGRSMTSSKKKQWYESKNGFCVEIISVLAFSIKNN